MTLCGGEWVGHGLMIFAKLVKIILKCIMTTGEFLPASRALFSFLVHRACHVAFEVLWAFSVNA